MNDNPAPVTRRTAVAGTVALCALVTGCARYGGPNTPPPPAAGGDGAAETTSDTPPAQTTGGVEPAPPGLATTSEIPVGGGTVFADAEVVLTQPTAGEFRCFSAVCTHQGCLVSSVTDGTINCDCHGSRFAIADGAVTAGPAPDPLAERAVRIDGDQLRLA